MMRKIAGYLTKNRSEKDQKIAQSTHENGYIKPRKTFWRNSKQLLTTFTKSVTSKNASEFKKLFKDLRNASELKTLRGWLEYLRTNQYKSKEEDLQSMVSR